MGWCQCDFKSKQSINIWVAMVTSPPSSTHTVQDRHLLALAAAAALQHTHHTQLRPPLDPTHLLASRLSLLRSRDPPALRAEQTATHTTCSNLRLLQVRSCSHDSCSLHQRKDVQLLSASCQHVPGYHNMDRPCDVVL